MISLIQGKIIANTDNAITVLTAGGVGYNIFVNEITASRWKAGREAEVFTYLSARENAMDLFGFASIEERELFTKFLQVSGIGPKTALHLLSLGSVEEISVAVNRGDVGYLTKVSGIGKKTAERIVVELRDKIATLHATSHETPQNGVMSDVVEGLVAMGYNVFQAREMIKKLQPEGRTSEQLLKEALQNIQ